MLAEQRTELVQRRDERDEVQRRDAPLQDLAGEVVGVDVRFAWTNPDPQEGDTYIYASVSVADAEPDFEAVAVPEVTVAADPSGTTCVDVILVRENGQSSDPVRGCVP